MGPWWRDLYEQSFTNIHDSLVTSFVAKSSSRLKHESWYPGGSWPGLATWMNFQKRRHACRHTHDTRHTWHSHNTHDTRPSNRIYTHMHALINTWGTYIHACIHAYMVYMRSYIACMYSYIACIYTYMHIYIHAFMTCIHTYIHVRIHTSQLLHIYIVNRLGG